jgi:hypothetical protein
MTLRKFFTGVLAGALVLIAPAHDALSGQPQPVEFSVPGAATTASPICGLNCGTQALALNDEGTVVGFYTDSNVVPHGFIRTRGGEVVTFDAPGAGLGANLNEGTVPYAINDFGVITGQYQDSSLVFHGFIRYPWGTFATFDATGAAQLPNAGTQALAINNWGETAGFYVDANYAYHGFVRSWNGQTVGFDPSGSVFTAVCQESCLNDAGTAVGYYADANGVDHGFVRTRDGKVTSFDGPNAVYATLAASINDAGVVAGYTIDGNGVAWAFIRNPDGTFSPAIPVPGAYEGANGGDVFYGINAGGTTTGIWEDSNLAFHGFTRSREGHITRFDAPGASDSVVFDGTRPTMLNAFGEVTGWWIDTNGLNHGFVFGGQ